MIQKLLIATCLALAIALGVSVTGWWARGRSIEILTAEKAIVQRHLDEANADIEQSEKNHNRIVQEKDTLLTSEISRLNAERDTDVLMAELRKDIQYAADSTKCRDSDPISALFDGLRLIEGQGLKSDDRLPSAGPTRAAAPDPQNAAGAAAQRK